MSPSGAEPRSLAASPTNIRRFVAIAFALTVAGAASIEWLMDALFPATRHTTSRLLTIAVTAAIGTVAAWWALRRQAGLLRRVAEESTARMRLQELQAQLLQRTVDLEDANVQLEAEVAERRKVESALRESEERYALTARGANDGLWDWNLGSGEVYLSDRWREMVGLAGRAITSSPEEWFSRVHLSDLPQLKVDIAAQAAGSRSHFLSEHRLRHAEGFFIWVLCRGIVVRDGDGRAVRIAGSMTDITARKDLEERLRREAQFDALTALPNRGYATDLLRRAIARSKRNKEQRFAVLFLDCDRFKVVNDSLRPSRRRRTPPPGRGTPELLRAARTTWSARLGGDEFVVILEGVHDEPEAISVAERIQHSLTQPFYVDGRELFMSVSVGIAMSQEGVDRPEDYLRDADLAMYRAKTRGRARHEVFRSDMRTGAV